MKKPEATKDQQLLEKLIRGGRKNLSEWFENIIDDFYEEQAIEERISVEVVQKKFYTDLTEKLLCSLSTLLFKSLIKKGVGHIVEPLPSLHGSALNPNWAEKKKRWEKFIVEREWE